MLGYGFELPTQGQCTHTTMPKRHTDAVKLSAARRERDLTDPVCGMRISGRVHRDCEYEGRDPNP